MYICCVILEYLFLRTPMKGCFIFAHGTKDFKEVILKKILGQRSFKDLNYI